jgi:hypothetical protein
MSGECGVGRAAAPAGGRSVRGVPVNVVERAAEVAIAPLWLACTASWGVTSALMLTWSAVRGRTPPPATALPGNVETPLRSVA